jgi:hypothetical protein
MMVLHLIVLWRRNSQGLRSKREGLPHKFENAGGRGDLIAVAVCVADLATSLARINPTIQSPTIRFASQEEVRLQQRDV